MRKPDFYIYEIKAQIRCALTILYFCYIDRTIPLISKSKISSLWSSYVAAQLGLCQTWSENLKTGFLTMGFINSLVVRKHVFGVSDHATHKSPCSAKVTSCSLEIDDIKQEALVTFQQITKMFIRMLICAD